MWMVLQGNKEVEFAIVASDSDMADLDGRNAQADQIFRAAHMVLQVIVGPLTMHREIGTYCYLLLQLLRPQCPLVEALRPQVVDAIKKDFASLYLQMGTIHGCTTFTYDVSCTIGSYLNACVKASVMVYLSDPAEKPGVFQVPEGRT